MHLSLIAALIIVYTPQFKISDYERLLQPGVIQHWMGWKSALQGPVKTKSRVRGMKLTPGGLGWAGDGGKSLYHGWLQGN